MSASKRRASLILTKPTAERPKRSPKHRPQEDYAHYDPRYRAVRPLIINWLNGKGPRPPDIMWLTAQDRDRLRRLHAKAISREDPRYFDALIEAAIAGDRLSKRETKDLAEHVRVMDDGFYPAIQNRTSELSGEARTLGHTITGARSRAASVRWLLGEGPLPDHVTLNFNTEEIDETKEAMSRLHESQNSRVNAKEGNASLRTDFDILAFETDIRELTKRNRLALRNGPRISRKKSWQALAKSKADGILQKRRFSRLTVLQLTKKLVGTDTWPTQAVFRYPFQKKTESISAHRLYDFLRKQYPPRHPQ